MAGEMHIPELIRQGKQKRSARLPSQHRHPSLLWQEAHNQLDHPSPQNKMCPLPGKLCSPSSYCCGGRHKKKSAVDRVENLRLKLLGPGKELADFCFSLVAQLSLLLYYLSTCLQGRGRRLCTPVHRVSSLLNRLCSFWALQTLPLPQNLFV